MITENYKFNTCTCTTNAYSNKITITKIWNHSCANIAAEAGSSNTVKSTCQKLETMTNIIDK